MSHKPEHSPACLTWGKLIGLVVVVLIAQPELRKELFTISLILSPIIIFLVCYFRRKKRNDQDQQKDL